MKTAITPGLTGRTVTNRAELARGEYREPI